MSNALIPPTPSAVDYARGAEAAPAQPPLLAEDPLQLFGEWLAAADGSEPNDPNAMTLATVDADGLPDARMVLLKDFGPEGFVFYTNLDSAKGVQLAANPQAALLFHWKSLRRQVRLRGTVGPVSDAEADAYFASRALLSRVGAYASAQSRPLDSRAELERAAAAVQAEFGDAGPPRPARWSGYRLQPEVMEFWRDGAFRLHDRLQFTRDGGGWTFTRLWP